jgi:hypothetical protein
LLRSRGYGDDRHSAELKLDATTESDGRLVISARALLCTTTRQRFRVVNDGGGRHYWFDVPLRARPRAADESWTDWWPQPGERPPATFTAMEASRFAIGCKRLPPE